jgi:hypothetical protein
MLLAAVTIFLGINQFIPNVIAAFVLYGGKYIVISFVVLFCFVLFSTLFDE